MVSEKDKQVVESSQGDPGTDEKKGITRVNEEKTEGKKEKKVAFPLGGHSTVSLGKDATGISSGDQKPPPENVGGKQDITNPLEGDQKPPPEKKEDIMPLDEESKKFIGEEIKTQTDPLKQKLVVLDEVKTGMDALRTVVEKINTTTPPTPQAKFPTKEELVEGTVEAIEKRERQRRQREKEDEARKKEREENQEIVIFCRKNPESEKCKAKTLPGTVREIIAEELKKREEKAPPKPEEKKPETPAGLQPLESMTEEKRKTWTDEQNKARDGQVAEIKKATNVTANDDWRGMSKVDKDKIADKPEMRERFLKTVTPEENLEIVKVTCKKDVCQVKLREGGFALMQEDKDGKFKPLDEEVAKKMEKIF